MVSLVYIILWGKEQNNFLFNSERVFNSGIKEAEKESIYLD
jgi:hypothetical protein